MLFSFAAFSLNTAGFHPAWYLTYRFLPSCATRTSTGTVSSLTILNIDGSSLSARRTRACPHSAPSIARIESPATFGMEELPPFTNVLRAWARFRSMRSRRPKSGLSSAPSMDLRSAVSPPAIRPTTMSGDTPKVGGHSEASRTPKRPLVPAPR